MSNAGKELPTNQLSPEEWEIMKRAFDEEFSVENLRALAEVAFLPEAERP